MMSKIWLASLLLLLCTPDPPLKTIRKKFGSANMLSEEYQVLRSDKNIRHGFYRSYFYRSRDQRKAIKKGIDSLAAFTKQTGRYHHGQMHGEWTEYASPERLRSKGLYNMGKKTGVWQIVHENGAVIEQYDHETRKRLPPIISVPLKYPARAREQQQEGTVMLTYSVNEQCILQHITVLQTANEACDNEARRVLKKYYEYMNRYGPPNACIAKVDTFEVKFVLD